MRYLWRYVAVASLLVALGWFTFSNILSAQQANRDRQIMVREASLQSGMPLFKEEEQEEAAEDFRVWLFVMVPVNRTLVLPYFLHHYLSLGIKPELCHVILHVQDEVKQAEDLRTMKHILQTFSVPFVVYVGEYTNHNKARLMKQYQKKRGVRPSDWMLPTDSDELQQWLPFINKHLSSSALSSPSSNGTDNADENEQEAFTSVPKFLKMIAQQNYTHVKGVLVDRLSYDGSLKDPLPFPLPSSSSSAKQQTTATTLEEQYPLCCNVSRKVSRGITSKIAAHRFQYPIAPTGAHRMLDHPHLKQWPSSVANEGMRSKGEGGGIMPIHHFKFVPEMKSMLEDRVAAYKSRGMNLWKISQRFLDHMNSHGGRLCKRRKVE
ncbi:hypothetical protein QOT17_002715 [Balamuthia mandrillaris]